MDLDLVQEAWQELKKYINTMDRSDAAEGLVSVLVENGVDAQEIQSIFGSDADVRSALSMYLDTQDLDHDDDDYDGYGEQDQDW